MKGHLLKSLQIKRNERGITLLELLIGGVILSLVGTLLVSMLIQNSNYFSWESNFINHGVSVNDIVDSLEQDLRAASAVSSSFTNSGVTFSSSARELVLDLTAVDSSGNPISNTVDKVVYYLDPTHQTWFRRKVYPDALSKRAASETFLTNEMKLLDIRYLDIQGVSTSAQNSIKVHIDITLSSTGKALGEQKRSLEMRLRNQ